MQFNPYQMNNNDVHTYISRSHLNESISFDDLIRYIISSCIKSKRKSKQGTNFEIYADEIFIENLSLSI